MTCHASRSKSSFPKTSICDIDIPPQHPQKRKSPPKKRKRKSPSRPSCQQKVRLGSFPSYRLRPFRGFVDAILVFRTRALWWALRQCCLHQVVGLISARLTSFMYDLKKLLTPVYIFISLGHKFPSV